MDKKDLPDLKVEEIQIKVPWGFVAGKWWGSKSTQPILALHGWLDNAGTFDTLIPLLPRHLSYLAIDFPGHGISSPIPQGYVYSTYIFVNTINFIIKEFKWKRISIMGHSMGSIVGFLYTSHFPNCCDLMIALDTVKYHIMIPRVIADYYRYTMEKNIQIIKWNESNSEPPNYPYDELIMRLIDGTDGSIDKKSAPYLLYRSIKKCQPSGKTSPSDVDDSGDAATPTERYYFSRDSRLKYLAIPILPLEAAIEMTSRIANKPYLIVKAKQSIYRENKKDFFHFLDVMKNLNNKLEFYEIDGKHHVHLTEPERVSDIVSTFLHKYCPIVKSSKL